MEPLRFSVMIALVIFGAYAEYTAGEYLQLAPSQHEQAISTTSICVDEVSLMPCADQ